MDTLYQLLVGLLSLASCGAAVRRMWQRDPSAAWYVSAAGFAAALFFMTLENAPWELVAVAALTAVTGIVLHIEPQAAPAVIDFDESTVTRRR